MMIRSFALTTLPLTVALLVGCDSSSSGGSAPAGSGEAKEGLPLLTKTSQCNAVIELLNGHDTKLEAAMDKDGEAGLKEQAAVLKATGDALKKINLTDDTLKKQVATLAEKLAEDAKLVEEMAPLEKELDGASDDKVEPLAQKIEEIGKKADVVREAIDKLDDEIAKGCE
jgi:chromosome segregation ATPase